MSKDVLWGVLGSFLGSLVEEGVEELFPGLGELGAAGEIGGFITGLLGSKLLKKEGKKAFESFITYAFKAVNKEKSENITEDEVKRFMENFKAFSPEKKKEIVSDFKVLDPYAYGFIKEFFKEKLKEQYDEA